MKITSPLFVHGGAIPLDNTQEGEDRSPSLVFEDIPSAAQSLVLICDDPDAPDPDAPQFLWLHWLIVNLPPDTKALAEDIDVLPSPAMTTINDSGDLGWSGPRPPIGTHRYFFHLYALDCQLDLPTGFTRAEAEEAMQGHILDQAQTFGTYRLRENS